MVSRRDIRESDLGAGATHKERVMGRFTGFSIKSYPMAVIWIVLFPFMVSPIQVPEKSSDVLNQPIVVCSSDTPIASVGESLSIRAWALSKADSAPNYMWTAGVGKIVGSGPEVTWDLAAVPTNPQPYHATATVTFPLGGSGTCSVEVTVIQARRGPRGKARSFLLKGEPEAQGYGLYSYLLFGSRPTDSSRERYLLVIRALLAGMEDLTNQTYIVPKSRLNLTYFPIETSPPPNATPEWLLEHYDYARAQALLRVLPGDLTDGPYIVSTLKPLSFDSAPPHYLFQNLTNVPTKPGDLIGWWVREFLHQAAQEHFWEPRTAQLLALKLRTTVAVLAIALPEVQNAIAGWVSWSR